MDKDTIFVDTLITVIHETSIVGMYPRPSALKTVVIINSQQTS